MAAITPTTLYTENAGSLRLHIANFASVDNNDTWSVAPDGIVSVMACVAGASATLASTGAGASFSGRTITMYTAETDAALTVHVYSQG